MRPRWRLSRAATFVLLMTLAALTALMPPRWTAWTGRLLQPLAWIQWIAGAGSRSAIRNLSAAPDEPTVSRRAYEELQDALADRQRQLEHQQATLQALAERVDELTGLRGQLQDPSMKIVLATVLGGDTSPARGGLTITPGALRGLAPGQWVVAGRPLDPNEVATGRQLLARHWVIGRVAQAHTHVGRVRLATDAGFTPVEVRLAQVTPDGQVMFAERRAVLEGAGGRMMIRQAVEDYFANGYREVFIELPGTIPTTLLIGRVVSARPRSDSPLHYDLEVEPPAPARRLTHVYVLVQDV